MVRAGVVAHPREWAAGGYYEIQGHRHRYRIVDRVALAEALEVEVEQLAEVHRGWVEEALRGPLTRQAQWSESVAVGGRSFAERVLRDLGGRARDRRIEAFDFPLRAPSVRGGTNPRRARTLRIAAHGRSGLSRGRRTPRPLRRC
jgi:hypothetical protein